MIVRLMLRGLARGKARFACAAVGIAAACGAGDGAVGGMEPAESVRGTGRRWTTRGRAETESASRP